MDPLSLGGDLDHFRGARVLITGHTGFKGSWLSLLLKMAGAKVLGYSLQPDSVPNNFSLLGLENHLDHVIGDVRDNNRLVRLFENFKPDFVFHLAAQALVKPSYVQPRETFEVNIMGTVNVLDCVRTQPSVKSLIVVTSDKCYENKEWVWGYRENDQIGGRDPYSASKGAAEIVFSSYLQSFFESGDTLGAGTVRAGNVIGGGDWSSDRVVPDLIRSIKEGGSIALRNPASTRPWQHVLEPLSGYCKLAKALHLDPKNFSGAWNFGPNATEVCSVETIISSLISKMEMGNYKTEVKCSSFHEANLLQLNCDKARDMLGWKPKWGIDKALSATSEWYVEYFGGGDLLGVCTRQIHEYFD